MSNLAPIEEEKEQPSQNILIEGQGASQYAASSGAQS